MCVRWEGLRLDGCVAQVEMVGVSPTSSCGTSCHVTSSIVGVAADGACRHGCREGVVRHMTGCETGLDETSQCIHNVTKDLGGVFLHVVTLTEGPTVEGNHSIKYTSNRALSNGVKETRQNSGNSKQMTYYKEDLDCQE